MGTKHVLLSNLHMHGALPLYLVTDVENTPCLDLYLSQSLLDTICCLSSDSIVGVTSLLHMLLPTQKMNPTLDTIAPSEIKEGYQIISF